MADLAKALEDRDARIDRLVEGLERSSRIIETLTAALTGTRVEGISVAPVAPTDTLTIAELWMRYVRSLDGSQRWVYNMVSMMAPTIAHFAPSAIEPRPRRGRFPARRPIAGPDMLASALRPHHWGDWRDELREKAKVGPTYRNMIGKRLLTFFNWAKGEGRVQSNPLVGTKFERKQPRRESTITELELQRILAAEDSPAFRAHLLICFDTGMRTDEARRLKWNQIDMMTGLFRLSWTVTKTKKSRTGRLMPRDILALRELPRYDHTEYVFARATKDAPYSQASFWRWFRAAADKAGVPCAPGDGQLHFHDATRHSFATRALRAGVALTQVQRLMGHATIQTTGIYLHATDADMEDAHRLLSEASRRPAHIADAKNALSDDVDR